MDSSLYYRIFHQNPFAMVLTRFEDGVIVAVNDPFVIACGFTREEMLGRTGLDLNLWVSPADYHDILVRLTDETHISSFEVPYRTKSGEVRYGLADMLVMEDGTEKYVITTVVDITRRRLAELELDTILRTAMDGFSQIGLDGRFLDVNDAFCSLIGYSRAELLEMRIADIAVQMTDEQIAGLFQQIATTGSLRFETLQRCKDGRILNVEVNMRRMKTAPSQLFVFLRDISEQRRSAEALQRRVSEMDTVNRISTAMRSAESLGEMLPVLLDETLAALDLQDGVIVLFNQTTRRLGPSVVRGWFERFGEVPENIDTGLVGQALSTGRLVYAEDLALAPDIAGPVIDRLPGTWGVIALPIRTVHEIVGLVLISFQQPHKPGDAQVRLLETLSEIAGNAIHRTRLHEQTQRSLKRMAALLEIFQTITSSLDLRITLDVILRHSLDQLEVDAAAVLRLSPVTHCLEYISWQGFKTRRLEHIQVRSGSGLAGRALYARQPVSADERILAEGHDAYTRLLREEGFISGYAISFQNKGQAAGVLEVYHRKLAPWPGEDWFDFLSSLAGQVALAVDKISLFESLQRSNNELLLAYDATIEGWSQAMDMRDQDTEQHTRRVTQMTIRLAEVMGIAYEDLVHIRRGALLHDLGKIGIPDNILRKPDTLTQDEWLIMRKHPQYAFDLLANNAFLRPALDIPYCHHERWDGSGYPQRLKGEQIPLAARLFAIVDVWDALTSDRSYRPRWSEERALAYIRDQSGKHFDPRVVQVFFSHLDYLLGRDSSNRSP